MIVLDTNVISEVFRPVPDQNVVAWLEQVSGEVAITSVTLAELLAGIRRLPEGSRRAALTEGIDAVLTPYRASRAILPFEERAADYFADIMTTRERGGRPIGTADAQIAAICRAVGARCATRNLRDFEGTGVELVNPWHV